MSMPIYPPLPPAHIEVNYLDLGTFTAREEDIQHSDINTVGQSCVVMSREEYEKLRDEFVLPMNWDIEPLVWKPIAEMPPEHPECLVRCVMSGGYAAIIEGDWDKNEKAWIIQRRDGSDDHIPVQPTHFALWPKGPAIP